MKLPKAQLNEIINRALAEDLGSGDITTEALIARDWQSKASILIKSDGVLAGVDIARQVFLKVDPKLHVEILIQDGAQVKSGNIAALIKGKTASILKAERTALNFLQHLSGIATETARYVEAVKGLPVKILDTRKTTPGLRVLEKYAVRAGGGYNHRMHLADGILIKDNHLVAFRKQGGDLKEIISRARHRAPVNLKIEVEVKTLEEAQEAVAAGADIIMLDNMDIDTMRQAVKIIKDHVLIEASGGVNLSNVRAIAETGVDLIAIGALTHSAKVLDISLELQTD